MARRTLNRQPFSVSTKSSDYPGEALYLQTDFKGLCTDKNDVTVNQSTFADLNNVYVDDDGVLVSRAPFKHHDSDTNILQEWSFGVYKLRLYQFLIDATGTVVTETVGYEEKDLRILYKIRCVSHETKNDFDYIVAFSSDVWKSSPRVTCAEVEDKIFVWFDGVAFISLNTVGEIDGGVRKLYFEDATKYIYLPVRDFVVNGIETEVEGKNFLTEAYRKRYQYSAFSSVDFEKLLGKKIEVNLSGKSTGDKSKYLYDITAEPGVENVLIYPQGESGDYHYDIVNTVRATVFLRYRKSLGVIDISFDNRLFISLPRLEGILGEPMLTKDGLCAVAFTDHGIAKCKLVAQETQDFITGDELLEWTFSPYLERYVDTSSISPRLGKGLSFATYVPSTVLTPRGYFETSEQFVYVAAISEVSNGVSLYGEWIQGDKTLWFCKKDITYTSNTVYKPYIKYITPTYADINRGPLVVLTESGENNQDALLYAGYLFVEPTKVNEPLKSDTYVHIVNTEKLWTDELRGGIEGYIYRLKPGFKFYADETDIQNGDSVLIGEVPIDTGMDNNYLSTEQYHFGDITTYAGEVYTCLAETSKGIVPSTNANVWRRIGAAFKIVESDVEDSGGNVLQIKMSWRQYYLLSKSRRGTIVGDINSYGVVTYTPMTDDVVWTDKDVTDLTENIGNLLYRWGNGTWSIMPWNLYFELVEDNRLITSSVTNNSVVGRLLIANVGNPATLNFADAKQLEIPTNSDYDTFLGARASALRDDLRIDVLSTTSPECFIEWGAGVLPWKVSESEPKDITLRKTFSVTIEDEESVLEEIAESIIEQPASYFKFRRNTNDFVTNNYFHDEKHGLLMFPVESEIVPIIADERGDWYAIEGQLWTSKVSVDEMLLLDDYIDGDVNLEAPAHWSLLSEYYFAYHLSNGTKSLQISSARYDEKTFYEQGISRFLLYLPKENENVFANTITALCPISSTEMGVFTQNEIWYVSKTTLGEQIVYTKPVRSKLPFGCREGDEVKVALDGQAILFPTERGIAMLSPQQFVATTEQSLSYLSDTIQSEYHSFYRDSVSNIAFMPNELNEKFAPMINICLYRYWILFHKFMDRVIYAFDTRTSTWWKWTTSYPIRSLSADTRLSALLQVDFTPIVDSDGDVKFPGNRVSMLGVSFVLTDFEFSQKDNELNYEDDVIDESLSGEIKYIYENEFIGNRRELQYASPVIDWHFTTQKLHLNQVDNYKCIKSVNLNLKGNTTVCVKFTTKAFRDIYHPENTVVSEISINELRTFFKRMNIMHVTNFQCKLENDTSVTPSQLKFNALGIKYEVKGRIS